MYIKQFCGFAYASRYRRRLCTWINKRGGWQNSPYSIKWECWIRLGRLAKNWITKKRGAPSIWNSRVLPDIRFYISIVFVKIFFLQNFLSGNRPKIKLDSKQFKKQWNHEWSRIFLTNRYLRYSIRLIVHNC